MAVNEYVNKVVYGNSTLMDISDTTAVEGDVASGKVFYGADGSRKTGTASGGGGGASNIVTGTFKGTTTGAAMEVNVPYTGTGYPVAIIVYASDGTYNNTGANSFYRLIQRYACAAFVAIKTKMSTEPSYSTDGTGNTFSTLRIHKNSTSSSTSYATGGSAGSSSVQLLVPTAPGDSSSGSVIVSMPSAKKMRVYIASTSYGFAANYEYTYHIIYSS